MSELSFEASLSLFPIGGPAPAAATVGFRFGATGTHTSRTMMFEELRQVLQATAPGARRVDYAAAIIQGNCLSKPTGATRRLTNQRLGELYGLDSTVPLFRVLRRLWDLESERRPLLALLAAIARDPMLAATCPSIIFLPANAEFQREAIKSALRAVVGNRLNDSTLEKVCRNAASTWTQSGHLEGRTFKKRRTVVASPATAAYAIYLSHAAGFRGAEIFSCAWLRILDCDPSRTFLVATLVTLATLLLAFPFAYLICNLPARYGTILLVVVLLPFWTSILVRTAAWTVLLQKYGLLNELAVWLGITQDRLELMYTRTGLVIAMTHIQLPFTLLPIYSVMRTIQPTQMRAAASLGARPLTAFRRVYLPQALPGVMAGCLLTFILCLGYYITPALIGGAGDQLISNFIANYVNVELNWEMAAALSFILLALTIALYAAFARLLGLDRLKLV